jgi:centrosomal protein CEP76
MDSCDPRVHRFYRTVGCCFNNRNFFANVQADDRVVNTCWELEDEYMWKGMAPSYLKTLTTSPGIGYVMPSALQNLQEEERLLEQILKDKISAVRRNEHHLQTNWDNQLGYLLSTALANYEYERVGGGSFAAEEFQQGIKNYVPEGHTFKAFPIQFTHFDSDRMITHIHGNKVGQEVFRARGDQSKHAIRVKIVQYPENISAVWVMLATRFRASK